MSIALALNGLNKLTTFTTVLTGLTAISSGLLALTIYNKTLPIPICKIDIKENDSDYTKEKASLSIESANGTYIDIKGIKHNNIECLERKGYYINKHILGAVTNEKLFSIYPINRKQFYDDCQECDVSTKISYKNNWGQIIEEEFKWCGSMY
jgi:hypothetical protein